MSKSSLGPLGDKKSHGGIRVLQWRLVSQPLASAYVSPSRRLFSIFGDVDHSLITVTRHQET